MRPSLFLIIIATFSSAAQSPPKILANTSQVWILIGSLFPSLFNLGFCFVLNLIGGLIFFCFSRVLLKIRGRRDGEPAVELSSEAPADLVGREGRLAFPQIGVRAGNFSFPLILGYFLDFFQVFFGFGVLGFGDHIGNMRPFCGRLMAEG